MNLLKNRLLLPGLLIAAAIFLGLRLYSRAEGEIITVCVKKDGLMHVIGAGFKRTQCNQNETLLSWNMQGPAGPKGDPGPAGPSGNVFHLFDGNGQDLGTLIYASDNGFTTFLSGKNAIIEFSTDHNNLGDIARVGSDGSPIFFAETGCSGDAYTTRLVLTADTLLNANFYSQIAHGHFYKITTEPVIQLQAKSRVDQGSCSSQGGLNEVRRVEKISLPFTVPPAWPLEIRSQ